MEISPGSRGGPHHSPFSEPWLLSLWQEQSLGGGVEEEPGVILRRANTKNHICGWDGWGLIVGTGEVLNVRKTRWTDVGNVNGCPNGGSESQEATDGKKLQIGVQKACKSSESRGIGLAVVLGKLNGFRIRKNQSIVLTVQIEVEKSGDFGRWEGFREQTEVLNKVGLGEGCESGFGE